MNFIARNVPDKENSIGSWNAGLHLQQKLFVDRYKEFTEAFKEIPHTIFFAAKAISI
ncbi:MAG: hypothetical protein MZV64_02455 [Ignavibacteriales bacterium]|nr:hypothetical protein [Ignavibacteriales bacterium]